MTLLDTSALGFPWETDDPFLFCVHHDDAYPAGNEALGPAASLAGRNLGSDFARKNGWSMYHGRVVPGFPQHPHRGFETVTVARRGFIDHSDSLGATARFGRGDTQWMTAGRGIVHAEMFPLLDRHGPNPVELFQIWLNLPKEDKLVEPHFAMLWDNRIPHVEVRDEQGKKATITVVAGRLGDAVPPPPPPKSWAARPDTDVAIWSIRLEAGATWTLPPTVSTSRRSLYFFRGSDVHIADTHLTSLSRARLRPDVGTVLTAGETECELLLLQGRPIAEPVAHHGPFVMSTQQELRQAFEDYQRTQFGGWPWTRDDPVHAADEGRFAQHSTGQLERPESDHGVQR